MASQVEICNIALANIRSQGINDINEASVQAQNCKLKYNLVLEFMLRDAPWNFAKKQVPLALLADDLFSWVYAYQYPSDCLRVNRLMSTANRITETEPGYVSRPDYYNDPLDSLTSNEIRIPYEIINSSDNKVIGCNEATPWVEYNMKVTDPNKFDSQFIMAFAWYLASEVAMPIIGGENGDAQRRNALQMYARTVSEATAINANEQDFNPVAKESDFILARG